jgi:hypothetical protein
MVVGHGDTTVWPPSVGITQRAQIEDDHFPPIG